MKPALTLTRQAPDPLGLAGWIGHWHRRKGEQPFLSVLGAKASADGQSFMVLQPVNVLVQVLGYVAWDALQAHREGHFQPIITPLLGPEGYLIQRHEVALGRVEERHKQVARLSQAEIVARWGDRRIPRREGQPYLLPFNHLCQPAEVLNPCLTLLHLEAEDDDGRPRTLAEFARILEQSVHTGETDMPESVIGQLLRYIVADSTFV